MSDSNPRRLLLPVLISLTSLFAFTGLYTTAFKSPKPHHIPVAVVAPSADATQLQAGLDRAVPGGFDVRAYTSEAAARTDLLDTHVQGVFVPGPAGDRAFVTGAFGTGPTAAVHGALGRVSAARDVRLSLADVAPLPSHDSRGLSSMFTVLGTVVPSLVFGAMLAFVGAGLPARTRWLAVAVFAVLAGLTTAVTVDVLVGALGGPFWGIAAMCAAVSLSVASAMHGLVRSLGLPGVGLGFLVMMVLGQAASGGGVTSEMVPGFFGAVAGWLPIGAGVTAVRNVVYFDGAALAKPLLVLGGWGMLGLTLELVAARRPRLALGLPAAPRPASATA